jgi:hypothetical protein
VPSETLLTFFVPCEKNQTTVSILFFCCILYTLVGLRPESEAPGAAAPRDQLICVGRSRKTPKTPPAVLSCEAARSMGGIFV